MSKVRTFVVIVTVVVLLAETAHYVQARPGALALSAAVTLRLSSRHLLSGETTASDAESVNLSNRDAEELDSEEELDAVCIENDSCDEKRLLIDSVDYERDGPNNPSDPPH